MGLPVEPQVPALYLQGASKSEIDRPPALLIVKVKGPAYPCANPDPQAGIPQEIALFQSAFPPLSKGGAFTSGGVMIRAVQRSVLRFERVA
jgi:hypothetical protein